MEFERLVSALDAEALADAAEALLEMLAGAAPLSLRALREDSSPQGGSQGGLPLPPGAVARPAGRDGEGVSGLRNVAADAALSLRAPRGDNSPQGERRASAEEIARLSEALAEASAANRRALGTDMGLEASASAFGEAAPLSLRALRGNGSPQGGRQAAGTEVSAAVSGGAETGDFESVSEFFRRDSRRYDSGFGE